MAAIISHNTQKVRVFRDDKTADHLPITWA